MTKLQICKRELATLFAHIVQETGMHWKGHEISEWRQGLFYVNEIACENNPSACAGSYNSSCHHGHAAKWYPCPQAAKDSKIVYFGRGPFQMSHNYNYGAFSLGLYADTSKILNEPKVIAEQGDLSLLSALWFYMNPQNPKPSIHEVVTEIWKPNQTDRSLGFYSGFGATTNIINGGLECGHKNTKAETRVDYFKNFAQYFKIEEDIWTKNNLLCENQKNRFSMEGNAAQRKLYWAPSWDKKTCNNVKWQTKWPVWIRNAKAGCIKDIE